MVITGSAIFLSPNDSGLVIRRLREFPQVTFQVASESGSELIVNFEAKNQDELEILCRKLRDEIPEIIDIGHIYINFEDEIDHLKSLTSD
ncbi:MAG: hypothetical protein AB7V04_01250 [Desulfomonilaceae bacterium]